MTKQLGEYFKDWNLGVDTRDLEHQSRITFRASRISHGYNVISMIDFDIGDGRPDFTHEELMQIRIDDH